RRQPNPPPHPTSTPTLHTTYPNGILLPALALRAIRCFHSRLVSAKQEPFLGVLRRFS
ncbi:unnamed protein product, partial [Musa banksii]